MKNSVKKMLKQAYVWINLPRFIPHLFCLIISNNRNVLIEDVKCWEKCYNKSSAKFLFCIDSILWFLVFYKEFRSLFYYRIPFSKLFKILASPMANLYITTPYIGKGLFIQHGFSTVISAKKIGNFCWINQQVTIGHTSRTDAPIIGDNVKIHAGAMVLGGIEIGDNSVIGANATVVKDVPAFATVVGPSASIIKVKGEKVN